uniref:Zinc finger protein 770 n=1 Tax=Cyprinus carpio carpio TaxID=630221 RepID=A0A9J7YM69_CYPCA
MLNISSQMSAQMQLSLLDEEGLDLQTGLTSAYSSKCSDGQWMEKKQEFEKAQEPIVTTQCVDNDVNAKVVQNKNHNGNKRVYECPVCLKRFGAPSKLKRHCLIHTDQRPFQCSICCRAFRERSHLKVHIRTHTNSSSADAVTTAGKRIFPVSKSSDHMCTLQLKKKSGYQCEICLKKFSFPSKLTRHLFVHFDDKAYTCTICRKSFKQACYLHKHLKVHTGERNGNSRSCSVPQKHGAKSSTPGAFECTNNCRLDSGNVCLPQILDSLETKRREKPECRSKLNQNVQFIESNSSTVENKNPDTLKHAEVQITTSSPIDLKHTHKGMHRCSICLKNFQYPSKLTRHILSHTDIRPFKCHVCLKSFQFRWHLQCHVRIHKKKGQNIIADHLEQDRTVSFSNAVKSEEKEVQISLQDGAEDSATVHQDQNMVKENMMNQKLSGDCSDSGVYLRISLLNEGRFDLPTEQSSGYSPKPSEGQWMEKNKESAKEKEGSVTTPNEDKNVNVKVLQRKNSNVNQKLYDCPVCHKQFGAPSELKRHCLIHTNRRPFQCSICCRAFRERSHLKVHIRTHTNPVKRRTRSLHSYKDDSVPCNRASKSKLKPSPKQLTAQDDTKSTYKEMSTVHQDQNMVTENMASQKICGDCSDSGVHLPASFLNEGGWAHHTELSSAYSSNHSEVQWMEEIQESEEEQEASVTTQTEDNDVSSKVWQNKNSNGSKRVYDCPVCHKRFVAPSELKRHCLIHTNRRPFQCSICCRVFRERSHLKVHIRTHTNPVKRRTRSLHSYKDNSVPCNPTSKSRLKPSPKYLTVQNNASSTEKQQPAVHQNENMVTEIVASQIIRGDCSEADAYLEDSLLNKEGLDLHTRLSCAYSSNNSEGQWMEEIQESEEEQEASVTTQTEDNDVNSKVLQSKNSNGSKRVYDCPVCHKGFGAPSELKRHCLIHTNQRPFQCSICCRAFRERSHLKVHFRTHNIEKRRAPSLQSYRDNSVPCNQASKLRLKPSPKQPTAQDNIKSTDKEKSTVHQDENMVIENMACQIISGDCSESDAYLQDSLLNKKGLDLHIELSSAYFSKPSEGQWMEENLETEEKKKESSVTTQSEDNDVNVKVLQSKNSDGNKRVYGCPVCRKQFGVPSELKRHCLIHTNQRPFQCSICCRAFRERSHLKVHIRTHTNPVKRRTRSLHSYKDNSVPCNPTSKSRLKPSPKYLTVQNNASSTEKQQPAVHQNENMVTEIVASQIIRGDCSESDAYLEDSFLNKEGLDLYTGLSCAYTSNNSEGQWMEEIQESEEEQEASVTTQTEDNDVNLKVWQNKYSNGSKRVYDCPVCHKRFGAPSELKRHCLIHTNQRPFQCSICCRAFRERSHLKVHIRTHTNPVKRRTRSLHSFKDDSVPCNRASKSKLKPSPKQLTAQDDTKSTYKEMSTVHQDQNMGTENMASQKICGDCNDSGVHLPASFLNEGDWARHTELISAYSSNNSEGQWMEEIQKSEEEQEASVTTQTEDNDVNSKVLQSKNSNGSKRVYDCPVCHKWFGAPSELKRHCLIHTNQRPFQCSICCRVFRERSHLKVHMKTHNVPVKRRTPSLQSCRDNRVSCNRASKSELKPSLKYLTAHNDTTSTNKQTSTRQQDQNVLIENMLSQKMSGGCSDSSVYLSKSTSPLENVENNKSVWGLTHKTDILLDGKKASDVVPFGRVSDCPPKTDSSLRHCAPESRTEVEWAHHMDDIEDCVFVDSDTVVTQCVPDSYEPSSCQYHQKPDVPRHPEVVVELEDFEDPGECFSKPPHDLPFCPDCCQSFRTIRNLYAHNCANRYPEGEMKKFHQCDICFKFFNAPSKLKRHYVTHTGQRPFHCTQCQRSFTQAHHLKTHMLSHR